MKKIIMTNKNSSEKWTIETTEKLAKERSNAKPKFVRGENVYKLIYEVIEEVRNA